MRIVICAAFYPPYRGGYAESVRLLAEGLASRGHAVTVVACDDSANPRAERVNGVAVCRVPAWNPFFLQGSFPIPNPFIFWRELRRAHAEGADIISTQTRFFPSTFIGLVFGKWRGIPVVHTERGATHTVSSNFLIRACALFADRTVGWIVCRFSDGVIGVSDAATDFTRRLGARNPVTVYNGIDGAWWHKPNSFIRTGDFLCIAFVGRLVHAKGVEDLLEAAASLIPEFPGLSLAIAGDGPYRAALMAHARALGIERAAIFYGAFDLIGIRDILWQSDIFVNPSYSEGFPRSVLEAAASGLPIVATNVGGTAEIIEDGVSGILVPHMSVPSLITALRRLIADGPLRTRIGSAAAFRARAFSIEKMVTAYEKNFNPHAVL